MYVPFIALSLFFLLGRFHAHSCRHIKLQLVTKFLESQCRIFSIGLRTWYKFFYLRVEQIADIFKRIILHDTYYRCVRFEPSNATVLCTHSVVKKLER